MVMNENASDNSESTFVGSTPSPKIPGGFNRAADAKINRDGRAKEFFWTVAIGKPTALSTMRTTSAAATRRFSHTLTNSNNHTPNHKPKPLPPTVTLPHPPLTLIRPPILSATLQAYFFRMQRATYRTCHPRQIHAEALQVVSTLLCDHPQAIVDVARTIYFAGIAKIDYSRTVALLVHDVMTELRWRNWGVKKALEYELVEMASTAFINCWTSDDLHLLNSKTGLDPIRPPLSETRTQIINVTAFLGDLFAMGLVPVHAMRSMISLLAGNLRTVTHCRGLYLLLLRASSHIAAPLGEAFLGECKAEVVERGRGMGDEMATRWLVEICNVIDRTLARDAEESTYAPLACHRWDRTLRCDSLLERLAEKPTIAEEDSILTSV